MSDYHSLPTVMECDRISATFRRWNHEAEERAKQCPRASVPSLHHLTRLDYDRVYEPSDDTFLLLDALELDFSSSSTSFTSFPTETVQTVLEIGCGTGVCTVSLAMRLCLSQPDVQPRFLVTDVNPEAIRITRETAHQNQDTPEASQLLSWVGDLASPLLESPSSSWRHAVDVLLFNPPYVPTPDEEVGTSTGIEASWAGGLHGRRVIDRAIPQIAQLLRPPFDGTKGGVAYMIVVDDNQPEELALWMKQDFGIQAIPYLRRRARNEYLTVMKLYYEEPQPSSS